MPAQESRLHRQPRRAAVASILLKRDTWPSYSYIAREYDEDNIKPTLFRTERLHWLLLTLTDSLKWTPAVLSCSGHCERCF